MDDPFIARGRKGIFSMIRVGYQKDICIIVLNAVKIRN